MLAYNLMSLSHPAALKASVIQSQGKDVQHTLKPLRFKLFAKAGYITLEGRKYILKLAVAMGSTGSPRSDSTLRFMPYDETNKGDVDLPTNKGQSHNGAGPTWLRSSGA